MYVQSINKQKSRLAGLFACLSLFLAASIAHAEDFQSQTKAGMAALEIDKFDDAEKHLTRAMESARFSGPKYGDYSISLINLGALYARKKQTSQAENYYREALGHYKKAYGEDSLECAKVYDALGDLYKRAAKYESAVSFFRKAKKVREIAAPNHTDLADTLAGLAQCEAKTANKDEAIPLMQKVISIREQAFGRTSAKVIKSRLALAGLYEELGKRKLAIPAYENVVSIAGTSDRKSATAYERLGALYEGAGLHAKAENSYKQALTIRQTYPGKNNEDLNRCIKSYAQLLRTEGKEEEAKQIEAKLARSSK